MNFAIISEDVVTVLADCLMMGLVSVSIGLEYPRRGPMDGNLVSWWIVMVCRNRVTDSFCDTVVSHNRACRSLNQWNVIKMLYNHRIPNSTFLCLPSEALNTGLACQRYSRGTGKPSPKETVKQLFTCFHSRMRLSETRKGNLLFL